MTAATRWGIRHDAPPHLLNVLDEAAGLTTGQLADCATECERQGRADIARLFRRLVALDLEAHGAAEARAMVRK